MGLRDFQNLLKSFEASSHMKFIYQGLVGTEGPPSCIIDKVDMDPEISSYLAMPGFTCLFSSCYLSRLVLCLTGCLLYRLVT